MFKYNIHDIIRIASSMNPGHILDRKMKFILTESSKKEVPEYLVKFKGRNGFYHQWWTEEYLKPYETVIEKLKKDILREEQKLKNAENYHKE